MPAPALALGAADAGPTPPGGAAIPLGPPRPFAEGPELCTLLRTRPQMICLFHRARAGGDAAGAALGKLGPPPHHTPPGDPASHFTQSRPEARTAQPPQEALSGGGRGVSRTGPWRRRRPLCCSDLGSRQPFSRNEPGTLSLQGKQRGRQPLVPRYNLSPLQAGPRGGGGSESPCGGRTCGRRPIGGALGTGAPAGNSQSRMDRGREGLRREPRGGRAGAAAPSRPPGGSPRSPRRWGTCPLLSQLPAEAGLLGPLPSRRRVPTDGRRAQEEAPGAGRPASGCAKTHVSASPLTVLFQE